MLHVIKEKKIKKVWENMEKQTHDWILKLRKKNFQSTLLAKYSTIKRRKSIYGMEDDQAKLLVVHI